MSNKIQVPPPPHMKFTKGGRAYVEADHLTDTELGITDNLASPPAGEDQLLNPCVKCGHFRNDPRRRGSDGLSSFCVYGCGCDCVFIDTNAEPLQPAGGEERLRLVKSLTYEFVRFNHDTRKTYLVTNVTDDCMLELEGMAGQFSPDLFQRVNDVPEHITMEIIEPVAQPAGEGEALELLPCPFCGTAAVISYDGQGGLTLHCDNYQTCPVFPEILAETDNEQWAIKTWNTRATQPATAPSDERFIVHEPTGVVGCNDSRRPVGATINGWPHPFSTPDCIYAATIATPTDVAERARRAADKIYNRLPGHVAMHINKGLLTAIIVAEFGDGWC